MIRFIAILVLLVLPATSVATAQSDERTYTDMPVYVLYCDEDPGRINAGGGQSPSPQELMNTGQCTPAEGVSLTFVLADDDWDFEKDDLADEIEWDVQDDGWFNRCDIDAEGFCALNSPTGFDMVIGVVLHDNTIKPGYTPAFFQRGTHNYTEFAGYGLALIPEDTAASPEADISDHQTLALNITHNGEPGTVLTEWEINDEDDRDTYLATNTDGWVSNIIAAEDSVQIDLVNIADDADVTLACSANDDASLTIESTIDDDHDLAIQVPDSESDIRCDIDITD